MMKSNFSSSLWLSLLLLTVISYQANARCSSADFQCYNGNCISRSLVCDGINSCGDNSDEIFCECHHGYFECDNGGCIFEMYECDAYDDCGDNSDEDGCVDVGLAIGLSVGVFILLVLCCIGAVICVYKWQSYQEQRSRPNHRVATTVTPAQTSAATVSVTEQHTNSPTQQSPPSTQNPAFGLPAQRAPEPCSQPDDDTPGPLEPPPQYPATGYPPASPQPYPTEPYPPQQAHPQPPKYSSYPPEQAPPSQ